MAEPWAWKHLVHMKATTGDRMTCSVDSSKFSFQESLVLVQTAQEQNENGTRIEDDAWNSTVQTSPHLSSCGFCWYREPSLLLLVTDLGSPNSDTPSWPASHGLSGFYFASFCHWGIRDSFSWNTHFFLELEFVFSASAAISGICCTAVLFLAVSPLTFTERELKQQANAFGFWLVFDIHYHLRQPLHMS